MLQNKPIAANIERDGFLTGVESDIFGDGAGQEGRGRQQAAQVELSDEDVEILLATPPGNLTEDQVRLIVENSDLLRRYLERQMVDSVNHLNLIKYK
ncbi:MAG: hypothetical protein IPJ69_11905 [Deltaproteobacteria bacterium]|nr:MAG: hypothetical protein IPJ69_11905 [Deltaproteobacteria bacterium]